MARSARVLLDEIEDGALDSKTALADVLRKCVALGGRAGSEQLRDWARRELDGYGVGDVELPRYRILPARICIDGADLAKAVNGQQISTWQLPEFARDIIRDEAPIRYGVAELEKLAGAKDAVELQHPKMPDVVLYMNSQAMKSQAHYGTTLHSMYWKVSPTSLHGVVDTIRTTLVSLVAEMRAAGFEKDPSAEVVNQAVNVVLHKSRRAKVTVNTNQSAGPSGSGQQTINQTSPDEKPSRIPTWIRGPWGVAVGLAGVAGAVAGVAVWIGWNPFS